MTRGPVVLAPIFVLALAADNGKSDAKEAVDFRKLKEVLPDKLGDLKRTEHTGQKVKMDKFTISMASATYAKEDAGDNAPRIEVQIADYGATQGVVDGMTAWAKVEIDRETDDGYERTVKIATHPGFETCNKQEKSCQLLLFVAQRFLLTIQTTNLALDQMKKLAESLPLDKLAAIK